MRKEPKVDRRPMLFGKYMEWVSRSTAGLGVDGHCWRFQAPGLTVYAWPADKENELFPEVRIKLDLISDLDIDEPWLKGRCKTHAELIRLLGKAASQISRLHTSIKKDNDKLRVITGG